MLLIFMNGQIVCEAHDIIRTKVQIFKESTNHLVLLIASPKPGVSTSVNFKLTPPSTRYTVEFCTWNVRVVYVKSVKQ